MRNSWDALAERPEPEDGPLRPGVAPLSVVDHKPVIDGDVWQAIHNGLVSEGYGPMEISEILGELGYDPTPQGHAITADND